MGDNTITAPANLSSDAVDEQTTKTFFCQNIDIRKLVLLEKLKAGQVESFKDDHHIVLDKVYADLILDKKINPDLVKLLKYALLITPSTADVERENLCWHCSQQNNKFE